VIQVSQLTILKCDTSDLSSVEEFFSFEKDIPTEDISDEGWERSLIKEHSEKNVICDEESDDTGSDAEIEKQPDVTLGDMVQMVKRMKHFALTKDMRFLKNAQELENLTETGAGIHPQTDVTALIF